MISEMSPLRRLALYVIALVVVCGLLSQTTAWTTRAALAQGSSTDSTATGAADPVGEAVQTPSGSRADSGKREVPPAPGAKRPTGVPAVALTFWDLYQKGGILMYPITLLSCVVICFGFERFFGLRRSSVLPRRLVKSLRQLASHAGGLDPAAAHNLCAGYLASGANVIRAMLASVGRPDAEIRQAVTAANEREASRLYFHVRWLNMAMNVAPMLGLLGTVQGMIIVFMGVSHLPPGANKAEYMADGIYLKLICTFAGLVVAIPAAVLSYLFEARIQLLLGEVEDLAVELLPHLKRFHRQRAAQRGGA
jgi:biopolymer transport protein ExbB